MTLQLGIFEWMKTANEYGVWGAVSTVILIFSFVLGVKVIFFPKKRVPHLNFRIHQSRGQPSDEYPLKINIEISNRTGEPCLLSHAFAMLKDLKAHATAGGDSSSGQLEIKFPRHGGGLSEIDYFFRANDVVSTWIPLDPAQTDDEVGNALADGSAGTFECTCTTLGSTLQRHKLRFKIARRL